MGEATLNKLRSDALGLSDRERAELAHDLLVSLDGPADADAAAAWDVEIQRRLNEVNSGGATIIDREEFTRKMRDRLSRI